ncbi:acetyltransferase [Ferviditalea candida]|uniref:Acetyltransferase n=1 Tax=Ferviditalea candida TaxID=3108399 RepID=A0ABU5ZD46_9BACL|nr:acetyltransferase [Paenibacillaceae bacterium T2]
MDELVIWGSGGHARVVKQLCEQLGYRILGFLDERAEMKGRIVEQIPVLGDLGDISCLSESVQIVCCGVGEPALRRRLAVKTQQSGFQIAPPLVHPSAHYPEGCKVGAGSIVLEHSVLSSGCKIGEFVIVNALAFIGHDTVIEDYATISPGASIGGDVRIGRGSFVGIGASVREKVSIGDHSVIGGGSYVMNDVPDRVLMAGVPAVFKKKWDENMPVFKPAR